MKTDTRTLLLILMILLLKPVLGGDILKQPQKNLEKVALITDRSIYISGEQLYFYATLFEPYDSATPGQRNILDCELITPDGNKIVSEKFMINKASASGCIAIPADLISGIYYIRAYTKLMRNYGPAVYAYKQIRIINPVKNELLTRKNNQDSILVKIEQLPVVETNDKLSVSVNKTTFLARDTISLYVKAGTGFTEQVKGLCLSVVPEYSSTLSPKIVPFHNAAPQGEAYYPENRGLSLTGKLTSATSRIPVRDKKINLSIIGEGRDFMAVRTDSAGQFYFSLPDYYGTRDLFLCAEKTPSTEVKIWVDNDFCTTPLHLPFPVFSLTKAERDMVFNMAQNVQINSNFHSTVSSDSVAMKIDKIVFYDKPSHIIYLDKYIQLPTLEECFNELPGLARVRQRKEEKYFYVLGSPELNLYDPLVLVDWVAVDEPSKILALSPQNISRIEFVNELYVKGGQTYGGIISIISKKGDFAGIDLPSTGIFVNYSFLSDNQCQEMHPDNYQGSPDLSNTLLWKPGISIQNGRSEKFEFTAPDTPGKYTIVLEGITKSGEGISVTGKFEVTN
jgi:hypothetical protein